MLKLSESDIMIKWNNNDELPLVSIRCITYNQEKYIEEALKGFLIQKTTFPFEIVVHDDASTDGTAEIIRKYEKKYPNIVKPIYETENQYSKQDGVMDKIIRAKMRGKYIAFCEGDDYWIDEYKLQKQVDFLENNPEYEMCYTDFNIKNEVDHTYQKSLFKNNPQKFKSERSLDEWVVRMGYVGPMTWVFTRKIYDGYKKMKSCDGTFVMFAHFLANTKVKCLTDETTAVYRVCEESASHSFDPQKIYYRTNNLMNVRKQLVKKYNLNPGYLQTIEQNYYTTAYRLICICGSKKEREKCRRYKKGLLFNIIYIFTSFKIGKMIFSKLFVFAKKIKTGLTKKNRKDLKTPMEIIDKSKEENNGKK